MTSTCQHGIDDGLPCPYCPPVRKSGRTGAQMAREMADLILDTFGSVHPTETERQALADYLVAVGVEWVNEAFELGLSR